MKRRTTFPGEVHATTILTVRRGDRVAIGGDGQATLNDTILKADVNKIRRLLDGRVICGFAGGTADCFTLLDLFEAKLKDYPRNMPRAAIELARQWRTDRSLQRLQALLAVVDETNTLLISGSGDVIEPSDHVLGIGSGGNFAVAAARALLQHTELSAAEVVREALTISAGIDIYSNGCLVLEELACPS